MMVIAAAFTDTLGILQNTVKESMRAVHAESRIKTATRCGATPRRFLHLHLQELLQLRAALASLKSTLSCKGLICKWSQGWVPPGPFTSGTTSARPSATSTKTPSAVFAPTFVLAPLRIGTSRRPLSTLPDSWPKRGKRPETLCTATKTQTLLIPPPLGTSVGKGVGTMRTMMETQGAKFPIKWSPEPPPVVTRPGTAECSAARGSRRVDVAGGVEGRSK